MTFYVDLIHLPNMKKSLWLATFIWSQFNIYKFPIQMNPTYHVHGVISVLPIIVFVNLPSIFC